MLNKIQIIGRMGKDPEVRYMPNGDAVCNFSVATSEKWKDKATGEMKEETTWHRVSAWGRQAEIVGEYLRKGSLVYVEGKMTARKYTDKDGAEKESHEIRMQDMKMLSTRSDSDHGGAPAPAPRQQEQGGYRASAPRQAPAPRPAAVDDFDDDLDSEIPF